MILSVCSLFVGVLDIRPSDLLTGSVETWEIFLISRLPRLLAILCTGIGMSVAGLIMQQLCIVDSIFVAQLSETALTAASLVYAIQFLMIAIGVGTAVGLNALLSRKLGQKKPEEACRAATTGLFLMLGTSLVFTLVGLLFSNQIAAALTNDPELQQLCREYLSVNLVFCWGIFLQTYGQRLLQAVGNEKRTAKQGEYQHSTL